MPLSSVETDMNMNTTPSLNLVTSPTMEHKTVALHVISPTKSPRTSPRNSPRNSDGSTLSLPILPVILPNVTSSVGLPNRPGLTRRSVSESLNHHHSSHAHYGHSGLKASFSVNTGIKASTIHEMMETNEDESPVTLTSSTIDGTASESNAVNGPSVGRVNLPPIQKLTRGNSLPQNSPSLLLLNSSSLAAHSASMNMNTRHGSMMLNAGISHKRPLLSRQSSASSCLSVNTLSRRFQQELKLTSWSLFTAPSPCLTLSQSQQATCQTQTQTITQSQTQSEYFPVEVISNKPLAEGLREIIIQIPPVIALAYKNPGQYVAIKYIPGVIPSNDESINGVETNEKPKEKVSYFAIASPLTCFVDNQKRSAQCGVSESTDTELPPKQRVRRSSGDQLLPQQDSGASSSNEMKVNNIGNSSFTFIVKDVPANEFLLSMNPSTGSVIESSRPTLLMTLPQGKGFRIAEYFFPKPTTGAGSPTAAGSLNASSSPTSSKSKARVNAHKPVKDVLLVATGSGVAPMISVIESHIASIQAQEKEKQRFQQLVVKSMKNTMNDEVSRSGKIAATIPVTENNTAGPIESSTESDKKSVSTTSSINDGNRIRLYLGVRTENHIPYKERYTIWSEYGIEVIPVISQPAALRGNNAESTLMEGSSEEVNDGVGSLTNGGSITANRESTVPEGGVIVSEQDSWWLRDQQHPMEDGEGEDANAGDGFEMLEDENVMRVGYVQDALEEDGVAYPEHTGALLCGQR